MATNLGQLIFTLSLEDAGFAGKVQGASGKVKESSNQMVRSNEEVEKSSHKTGGAFSSMAGQFVAGAALFTVGQKALGVIKSTLDEGVQSYKDWQTQNAVLVGTLKTTHNSIGMTKEEFDHLAESMQKHTAVSREANLAGIDQLLTFGNISKNVLPQTADAVSKLSSSMASGAIPNTQMMTDASKQLGKAMDDPAHKYSALARNGVDFSASQIQQMKSMQASGNIMGAQKVLLQGIDHHYASLSFQSDTWKFKTAQLHNQINDFIGNALDKLVPILKSVVMFFLNNRVALLSLGVAIGLVAVIISVALVGALFKTIAGFVKMGIESAKATAESIGGAVKTLASWTMTAVKMTAQFVATGVKMAASAAMTAARWVASAVMTAAAWIVTNAIMIAGILLIVVIVAFVVVEIIKHWHQVWDFLKGMFSAVVNFVKKDWDILLAILLGPVGIAILIWRRFHDQIISFFMNAVSTIEGVWNSIVGFFGRIISSITGAIRSGVSNFGSLLFNAGKDLINGLIHGVENMAGAAEKAVEGVGKGIENTAKKILKILSPSKVFADIGANVSLGMAQGISDNAHHAITATSSLANQVTTAGVPTVSNVTNSQGSIVYQFGQGSVQLTSASAVDRFFSIGNRNTQLEMMGGSPLAGTTGV